MDVDIYIYIHTYIHENPDWNVHSKLLKQSYFSIIVIDFSYRGNWMKALTPTKVTLPPL